ncbi:MULTISPECIES: winged helix-turn-helix domain-containing protein [unclassified Rothia (in: high G+C Gram-positive bacteria)]|uniref:winged helix-turn-helix domain-containing protein n=1 Tax=unclassified Rothia (in: high G+C Gram-positive bacteria) TaxID=2689056 RepID=UPI001957D02F|nr:MULTISPECIES: winged helix-turn-helix domain-containing protein [unclassified Rothia (in: high G+C Gram-positive bacteria)]MBM7051576.1 winged helix-turn-helix transcriptional regulator [Rothia sp. ZJ1223]QRZ61831.1 winged helix-turn-helix transcriptional regulator [Rothia sp. ZJ932]
MSGAPGYVHISQRGRTGAHQAAPGVARSAKSYPANLRPMTASVPEPPAPSKLAAESEARGFVLYVGLSEEAAAAKGTSLVRIVQDLRAYTHNLVSEAESYAAVALAPTNAEGSDLEVVRNALGDPTAVHHAPEPAAPRQGGIFSSDSKPTHTTGVLIDLSRREVFLDGELLNLTFKEFELLNYLVENGARTVAREELLHSLWHDAEEVPNERTIDVHIRRLRSKLGRLSNTVRTVRGQGYRFYEHPEVVIWAAPEYSI